MNKADHECMLRAIQLAKRGLFTTAPNPRVGCIITTSNGATLAEGWHQYAGEAHAEINALNQLPESAKPHTVYVTLEPCCHQGKTGPCSQALIRANVSRVVVAMLDPNPLVAGKGMQELRDAGIEVTSGLLQSQAEAINLGFIKRMNNGMPRVQIKTAMSLDGRTALASGESQWITTPDAREDVHRLRAASCAILTGIGTVLQDDPSLNARLPNKKEVTQPLRVIVDSSLQTPLTAKILSSISKTVIYTISNDIEKKQALISAGADVYQVDAENGQVKLSNVLEHLAQYYAINELMVEAGAHLSGAFIQAKLVDQLIMYVAPSLLGHDARAAFSLIGVDTMKEKVQLENIQTRMVGADIRITATIKN